MQARKPAHLRRVVEDLRRRGERMSRSRIDRAVQMHIGTLAHGTPSITQNVRWTHSTGAPGVMRAIGRLRCTTRVTTHYSAETGEMLYVVEVRDADVRDTWLQEDAAGFLGAAMSWDFGFAVCCAALRAVDRLEPHREERLAKTDAQREAHVRARDGNLLTRYQGD